MSHLNIHAMCVSFDAFPFPRTDLKDSIEVNCEIYSVILPICTVATAAKAMCEYCSRGFGRHENIHFESLP
jgi:hypothetical protein